MQITKNQFMMWAILFSLIGGISFANPDLSENNFSKEGKFLQAKTALVDGFPEVAAFKLENLIQAMPEDSDLREILNNLYLEALVRAGKHERVIDIQNLTRSDKSKGSKAFNPNSIYWLALALWQSGDLPECQAFLNTFKNYARGNRELKHYHLSTVFLLAELEWQNSNPNSALEYLREIFLANGETREVLPITEENNYYFRLQIIARMRQAEILHFANKYYESIEALQKISLKDIGLEMRCIVDTITCRNLLKIGKTNQALDIYENLTSLLEQTDKPLPDTTTETRGPYQAFPTNIYTLVYTNYADTLLSANKKKLAIELIVNFILSSMKKESHNLQVCFDKLDALGFFKSESYTNLINRLESVNDPKTVGFTLFFHAKSFIEIGKVKEATEILQTFVKEHRQHECYENAIFLLGESYVLQNKTEEEIQTFIKNLKANNDENLNKNKIDFLHAQLLIKQEKFEKAAEKLETVRNKLPQSWQHAALYNAIISKIWSSKTNDSLTVNILLSLQNLSVLENEGEKKLSEADILFEKSVKNAQAKNPNSENDLKEFIKKFPNDPRTIDAYLYLSEIQLEKKNPDIASAREFLKKAKFNSIDDSQREKTDYIEIWLDVQSGKLESAEKRCKEFIINWQNSSKLNLVMMKRAEILFNAGNFAEAKTLFLTIAKRFPESEFVTIAKFLAGKSAMGQFSPKNLSEAFKIFSSIVNENNENDSEPEFTIKAKFLQAEILRRQNKNKSANYLFQEVFTDATKANLRDIQADSLFAINDIILSSDNKNSRQNKDEMQKLLTEISQNYQKIIELDGVNKNKKYKSFYQKAKALEEFGASEEASEIYYDLYGKYKYYEKSKNENEHIELDWIMQAGFRLIAIKEQANDFKQALQIAKNLSQVKHKRSNEAKEIANFLRLKHFIWE